MHFFRIRIVYSDTKHLTMAKRTKQQQQRAATTTTKKHNTKYVDNIMASEKYREFLSGSFKKNPWHSAAMQWQGTVVAIEQYYNKNHWNVQSKRISESHVKC